MFKLIDKKIIAILLKIFCLTGPMEACQAEFYFVMSLINLPDPGPFYSFKVEHNSSA